MAPASGQYFFPLSYFKSIPIKNVSNQISLLVTQNWSNTDSKQTQYQKRTFFALVKYV